MEKIFLTKIGKKGKAKIHNLKNIVEHMERLDPKKLLLISSSEPGKNLRPAEIIKQIFDLSDEFVHQARIIKLSARRLEDVQATDY